MSSVKVNQGKTDYYVIFDEAGAVISISGVAVLGKLPRYKGGTRRVAWSGGHWHASSGKPIPKQLQPIAEHAIQTKELPA